MINNKGLKTLEIAEVRIITLYKKLIDLIELQDLKSNLENINISINWLEEFISIPNNLPKTMINIARQRYIQLEKDLKSILPITLERPKRGIFNPLGTLIKSITGNLDHNDFVYLKNAIIKLDNDSYTIHEQFQEQIKLNQDMINRFENITQFIDKTMLAMRHNIAVDAQKTNLSVWTNHRIQDYGLTLDFNINLMKDQINKIHEIITFAKIKVISTHILDNHELYDINQHLINNSIHLKSEEQIYSLLEIQAYYNDTNLIIIIQVPEFYKESLTYYQRE